MIHEITILGAEIIQGTSKRYGLKLTLSFKFLEEIVFYDFFWFGNYKDFQKDTQAKSYFIWKKAIERFNNIILNDCNLNVDILNFKFFIGYTFNSEVEVLPDSDFLSLKG